jgi:hypothetical protein
VTGINSRCKNIRPGQGDMLVTGSGTAASHSFMHCQKYGWLPILHPAICYRLGIAAPSCSHRPPTVVSAVRRASHGSAPSFRILAPSSIQRLADVLGIACSPRNPPKTAKTVECIPWVGWRQSAARARHLQQPSCTASPAAQCWPGTGTPPPGLRMTSLGSAPTCHKKGIVGNVQ